MSQVLAKILRKNGTPSYDSMSIPALISEKETLLRTLSDNGAGSTAYGDLESDGITLNAALDRIRRHDLHCLFWRHFPDCKAALEQSRSTKTKRGMSREGFVFTTTTGRGKSDDITYDRREIRYMFARWLKAELTEPLKVYVATKQRLAALEHVLAARFLD